MCSLKSHYHLPGLFEFYELYKIFLPLYREHPEYFYDWCDIASIYGSPEDCLWGGGRTGFGTADAKDVLDLMNEFNISPRFTFSNSLLRSEHLLDKKCNRLCKVFLRFKSFCWYNCSFWFVVGLSKKSVSAILFCFFHHKGFNRFLWFWKWT